MVENTPLVRLTPSKSMLLKCSDRLEDNPRVILSKIVDDIYHLTINPNYDPNRKTLVVYMPCWLGMEYSMDEVGKSLNKISQLTG
jgi:hypothetical protein